jgi:hypothetical protein
MAFPTTPAENTPPNISGKSVIISNLIQLQKALRRIDHDLFLLSIHADTYTLCERDQDFPIRRGYHQQIIAGSRQHILDLPDCLSVQGYDRKALDLVKIDLIFSQRLQILFRNQDIGADELLSLGDGIYAPQPDDNELFKFPSGFYGKGAQTPFMKNIKP